MKYKLTRNTKIYRGVTLFQIQALKSFSYVAKGDLGGWIEKEGNLSQERNCWVYENALALGKVRVHDDSWVYGNICLDGNVCISGGACISENV